MAKSTRKNFKLFASAAGTNQLGVIGSFANGLPAYATDPEAMQALSQYLTGWFGIVDGQNSPAIEDMNALCYVFAYMIFYQFEMGLAEWNTDTTYYIGSLAQDGSGNIYKSIADNNQGHALTNNAYWVTNAGFLVTKTTTYGANANDRYILADGTGAGFTVTLPAVATVAPNKQMTIKCINTNANVITVKGNGAELVDGNNTYGTTLGSMDSLTVVTDGTAWYVI